MRTVHVDGRLCHAAVDNSSQQRSTFSRIASSDRRQALQSAIRSRCKCMQPAITVISGHRDSVVTAYREGYSFLPETSSSRQSAVTVSCQLPAIVTADPSRHRAILDSGAASDTAGRARVSWGLVMPADAGESPFDISGQAGAPAGFKRRRLWEISDRAVTRWPVK